MRRAALLSAVVFCVGVLASFDPAWCEPVPNGLATSPRELTHGAIVDGRAVQAKGAGLQELTQIINETLSLDAEAAAIQQLRGIITKHPNTMAARRAELAIRVPETRSTRTLGEISRALAPEPSLR